MMTREERAKQFAPFDAMKGLSEALRDREERHSRTEKREISEEDAEKLSYALYRAEEGNEVTVEYFENYHDVRKNGVITRIDKVYRYLIIGGNKIFFDDIYSIVPN